MPIMDVRTLSSQQKWSSPDGTRKIFEVAFDYNGSQFKAQTYSEAIAQVGWSGQVESYEKPSNNPNFPPQTFVKQPPKENASYGGGGGYSGGGRPSGTTGKPTTDQFTMYLSYAKDLMVARVQAAVSLGDALPSYAEMLEDVMTGGKTLYDGRPGAEPKTEAPKVDDVHDVNDEPLNLDDLPEFK